MSKSHVAMGVVSQLLAAAKPGAAVALAAGTGAVAAQLGGALVKEWGPAANFAAGGAAQEMLVDIAGGAVLDGVALLGAAIIWDRRFANQLAPFLIGGSLVSAVAPLLQPYLTQLLDATTALVAGGGIKNLNAPGGYDGGQRRLAAPGGAHADLF